jgi:hypothetical protein
MEPQKLQWAATNIGDLVYKFQGQHYPHFLTKILSSLYLAKLSILKK